MKRTTGFLLLIVLAILLCGVSTAAATDEKAYFDWQVLNGNTEIGGEVTVRFQLNGISAPSGASLVEAHISYPTVELELLDVKANHPDGWDFDKQIAEDWTSVEKDSAGNPIGSISFIVMNMIPANGVKDDHVLYVDATFRVLKSCDVLSVFSVQRSYYTSFVGEKLEKFEISSSSQMSQPSDELSDDVSSDDSTESRVPTSSETDSKIDTSVEEIEEDGSVNPSEDGNEDGALSLNSLHETVDEEKTFRYDTLAKILIASISATLMVAIGVTVYVVRKKKKNG